MPCIQGAARKEREEYIRKNRRDVNEFVGVDDPVEVLKIIHRPKVRDELVNRIPYPIPTDQIYSALHSADRQRLQEYAASVVGTDRHDEAEDIALCLAAFTEADLDDCLRAFINHGRISPSLPFRKSSPQIRDELIDRVNWDNSNRNHTLLALAWIGDATVVELFNRWRHDPPPWAASMNIRPEDYAREAGWELADSGEKRQLYYDACHVLVKGPSSAPAQFRSCVERADSCPWCGMKLTNLVKITPSAFGLLDEYGSDTMQVTACEVCAMFAPIFGRLDMNGHGEWASANARPEYLPNDASAWERLPEDSLSPGPARPPLFAADQFLPTTFSQLGGHPTWIQFADYPRCLDCRKSMLFLGQIDNSDIVQAEGMYYTFACPGCRTTATSYQQT